MNVHIKKRVIFYMILKISLSVVRTRENILLESKFHGFSPVLHKTLLQKFRYNAIVMSICSFLVIQYKIKY